MRFAPKITMDYICHHIGIHPHTVQNRCKIIFSKSFSQLTESEKVHMLNLMFYEYHKEMPRITRKEITEVNARILYIMSMCKLMQIQDSMNKGLYHEIDKMASYADLIKMSQAFFSEQVTKIYEEENKGVFPKLGDLVFTDDFMLTDADQKSKNKTDSEPEECTEDDRGEA